MTVNSTVTADLFYFSPPPDGTKPVRYLSTPPKGTPVVNYKDDKRVVSIENVRGKEDKFTLDTSGFQFLLNQPTKVKTFDDDKEVQENYYPESVDIIKRATGASKVFIFDHSERRVEGETGIDDPKKRIPAGNVHVDQTPSAAISRAHRYFASIGKEEEAERLLKTHRFQIVNFWRPINHPAHDRPLALCDYRSVNTKEDLAPIKMMFPGRIGETCGVKWNPKHEWKYLKGMGLDEVVLIKCYDSVQEGNATLTPHTAFIDPSTPAGSPPRESIELRALVFYEQGNDFLVTRLRTE
ncbi:hypothetical protein L218DRAFT_879716 [Marasmius fiardii PR-910]|nr:hypothetical protein L218DRAFT_879716 [Marasmius fiardii PR-910]